MSYNPSSALSARCYRHMGLISWQRRSLGNHIQFSAVFRPYYIKAMRINILSFWRPYTVLRHALCKGTLSRDTHGLGAEQLGQ
jgi:hypothetical protein